jgi:hypothetical protein
MQRFRLISSALALLVCGATVAEAQECPAQTFRWAEDCRALSGTTQSGVDRLRYVELAEDGSAWATFGAEYRVRAETLSRTDFGIGGGPSFTTLSQRAYGHVDLRTRNGPRLFAQFSAADEDGRKPGPRAVDESRFDIAQFFVDAPVGDLRLRVGRQELDLGGNRLVSLRDAALRRSFDGVNAQVNVNGFTLTAFAVQPVQIDGGAFDDAADRSDDFSGAMLRSPVKNGRSWTLFAFDRRRDRARTFALSGKERRQTYGARYVQRNAKRDLAVQAAFQDGEIAGRDIRAFGAAVDAGYRIEAPWSPRLGVSAGYASGDRNAGDDKAGGFDPLYPNLSVFTEAPLYFPTNQINTEINVTANLSPPLTLRLNAIVLARASTGDAIYSASGRALSNPPGSDRLGAALLEATARWTINSHMELYGSVVRAKALDAVRTAGGRDTTYAIMQITTRF